MGQTLDILLPLQLEPGQGLADLCLQTRLLYGDAEVPASSISVTLDRVAADGQALLRLRSSVPVNEPILTLHLQLGCQTVLRRSYTLLPEPELPAAALPPAPARPEPALHTAAVAAAAPVDIDTAAAAPETPIRIAPAQARPPTALPARSKQAPALAAAAANAAPERAAAAPKPGAGAAAVRPPGAGARLQLDPIPWSGASTPTLDPVPAQGLPTAPNAGPAQTAAPDPIPPPDAYRVPALELEIQALRAEQERLRLALESAQAQLLQLQAQHPNPSPVPLPWFLGAAALALLLLVGLGLALHPARRALWARAGLRSAPGFWWRIRPGSATDPAPGAPPHPGASTGKLCEPDVPCAALQSTPAVGQTLDGLAAPAAGTDMASDTGGSAAALTQVPVTPLNAQRLLEAWQQADFFESIAQPNQAMRVLADFVNEFPRASEAPYLRWLWLEARGGATPGLAAHCYENHFLRLAPTPDALSGTEGLEHDAALLRALQAQWPLLPVRAVLAQALASQPGEPQPGSLSVRTLAAFDDLLLLLALLDTLAEAASEWVDENALALPAVAAAPVLASAPPGLAPERDPMLIDFDLSHLDAVSASAAPPPPAAAPKPPPAG